jgi:hypothetical protein
MPNQIAYARFSEAQARTDRESMAVGNQDAKSCSQFVQLPHGGRSARAGQHSARPSSDEPFELVKRPLPFR